MSSDQLSLAHPELETVIKQLEDKYEKLVSKARELADAEIKSSETIRNALVQKHYENLCKRFVESIRNRTDNTIFKGNAAYQVARQEFNAIQIKLLNAYDERVAKANNLFKSMQINAKQQLEKDIAQLKAAHNKLKAEDENTE